MGQTVYGSITLVELSDSGQLSVYPTSNLPLSIVYDPDQNTYVPNWGTTNLLLEPVVYYNNQTLSYGTTGLTITWKRRESVGEITNLTEGETVVDGDLTVSTNKFTPSSTMISYIVTASYLEPESQQTLTAQGQITFSLVRLASSAKTCSIIGDSVFKYNTNQQLVGSGSITLTAKISNVSIDKWQYRDVNQSWVLYPNSGQSLTLTVDATDNVFVNDVATIRLLTSDNNVFDIHTITKLRDGVPGMNTLTAILTNEDQMVPFPAEGQPDFSQAKSRIIIYDTGIEDTQNWTITQTYDNIPIGGATPSATTIANDTVAVTAMTGDSATVTFTCQRQGKADIIKSFSIVKMTQGADGKDPVVRSLECSSVVINKSTIDSTISYTPESITVNAYSQTGNNPRTSYSGRIVITSNDITIHSIETDESTYTITNTDITAASVNGYMTVALYEAGGTTNLYDLQTIVITSDGAKGDQGEQGTAGVDSINVILGNYADIIPCTSDNRTQAVFTIDIPFTAYRGIEQVGCNVATPPQILGVTASVTPATPSSTGHITYAIPVSTLVESSSENVLFTFICVNKTIVQTYRWTRSTAAVNGVNARLFELYTTSGNTFTSHESQNITIYARLMDGATDQTNTALVTNWVWSKWDDGEYRPIITTEGKYVVDGSRLTVNNSAVDGYASFKCTCEYDSTEYTGYYVLLDKSDPIQATIMSTLGEQIVNGQGVGAVYVLVTDSGTGREIDALKTDKFLTGAPINPSTGDYYYRLDQLNKTVTLKKYDGAEWINAPTEDLPKGDYTWTFRDKDGNSVPFNGANQQKGKVLYIDGTLINKKIVFDIKVEI